MARAAAPLEATGYAARALPAARRECAPRRLVAPSRWLGAAGLLLMRRYWTAVAPCMRMFAHEMIECPPTGSACIFWVGRGVAVSRAMWGARQWNKTATSHPQLPMLGSRMHVQASNITSGRPSVALHCKRESLVPRA